jgi:hypothetical protein
MLRAFSREIEASLHRSTARRRDFLILPRTLPAGVRGDGTS